MKLLYLILTLLLACEEVKVEITKKTSENTTNESSSSSNLEKIDVLILPFEFKSKLFLWNSNSNIEFQLFNSFLDLFFKEYQIDLNLSLMYTGCIITFLKQEIYESDFIEGNEKLDAAIKTGFQICADNYKTDKIKLFKYSENIDDQYEKVKDAYKDAYITNTTALKQRDSRNYYYFHVLPLYITCHMVQTLQYYESIDYKLNDNSQTIVTNFATDCSNKLGLKYLFK